MTSVLNNVTDKVRARSFTSKSISHISKYQLVQKISYFLLSFTLLNFLYQQVLTATNLIIENIVVPYKFIYDNLTWIDNKFDSIILTRVDKVVGFLPDVTKYTPFKVYHRTEELLEEKYLKPTNEFIYNSYDKYLPATVTENKTVFKLNELTELSEFNKFFIIVNEFLSRFRVFVFNKSNEASHTLVSKYNNEVNVLNEEYTGLSKNVVASYKTSVGVVKDLNNEYFKPLKSQTQDYVVEVATNTKNKADNFISEAKQQITPRIDAFAGTSQEIVDNAAAPNGNILVNASA